MRKATKIAKESRPLAGWLVVLSSRSEEIYRDYRIYEGRNKVGRAGGGSEIQVNDEEISNDQAVITAEDDEYYITDVFELMKSDGLRVEVVDAVPSEDVLSINTLEQLSEVEAILAARGVTHEEGA